MEQHVDRLLEALSPLMSAELLLDLPEHQAANLKRILAHLLDDILRLEIPRLQELASTTAECNANREGESGTALSPSPRAYQQAVSELVSLRTTTAQMSEAMKRLEQDMCVAKSGKARQESLHREMLQSLARDYRAAQTALTVSQQKTDECMKAVAIKDGVIYALQLDLAASASELKHSNLALSKVNERIHEAVERERSAWQRTSRYNSGQVLRVSLEKDILRQQLSKERDASSRSLSPSPSARLSIGADRRKSRSSTVDLSESRADSGADFDHTAASEGALREHQRPANGQSPAPQSRRPQPASPTSDRAAASFDNSGSDLASEGKMSELVVLREDLSRTQSEMMGVFAVMDELQRKIEQLSAENQRLSEVLVYERELHEELQRKVEHNVDKEDGPVLALQANEHAILDLEQRVILLAAEKEEKERKYCEDTAALQAIVGDMEQELHEAFVARERVAAGSAEERESLGRRISGLSCENEELRRELAEETSKRTSLANEVLGLGEQLADLRTANCELQSRLETCVSEASYAHALNEIGVLQQQLMGLRTANEELVRAVEVSVDMNKYDEKVEEAEEWKQQVRELTASIEELHGRYASEINQELSAAFENRVDFDNEIAELSSQYEKLNSDFAAEKESSAERIQSLESELQGDRDELQQLRALLRRKTESVGVVASMSGELADLLQEKADLHALARALEVQRLQLEQQKVDFADEMRQSRMLLSVEREESYEYRRNDAAKLEEAGMKFLDFGSSSSSEHSPRNDPLSSAASAVEHQEHTYSSKYEQSTWQADLTESSELRSRLMHAEARAEALSLQLQSMPPSLLVAQAERRVFETRLVQSQRVADAKLSAFKAEMSKVIKENEAQIALQAKEKAALQDKFSEQAQTVHQLTLHVQLLLTQENTPSAVLKLPPAPWQTLDDLSFCK